MNYQTIKRLQIENGYGDIQDMINSGTVWKLEGSQGRYATSLLESGACMLPKQERFDYYDNRIPSRDELKQGTKGTYHNCKRFWEWFEDVSLVKESFNMEE